jgi:hypothetical protein
MHILVIAWLYVIGTMALTASSALAGIALFAVAGLLPVLACLAWLVRSQSRARRRASGLEQHVHAGDDPDAEADQRELAHGLDGLGTAVQARDQVGDGDVEQARRRDGEHRR